MGEGHGTKMMWDGKGFMGPFAIIASGALIVFLGIILIRWLWPGSPENSFRGYSESPLEVLKRHYATGEIEKEIDR